MATSTLELEVPTIVPAARPIGEAFVQALAANDRAQFEAVFTTDVGLRQYGIEYLRILRGLDRVVQHFQDEFNAAPDTQVELVSAIGDGDRAAVEYRVRYTLNDQYLEDFRTAVLQLRDGQVHTLDVYRTAPLLTAHGKGWIAPPDLSEEQIAHLFQEWENSYDIREYIWPNANQTGGLHGGWGGTGDAHPGSNGTGGFSWPADVADQKIEELIERYRSRGIGFTWYVSPFNEPKDLAERLERHGLLLAGDHVGMARVGLDPSDIRTNPNVEMVLVDGSNDQDIEDAFQVIAQGFHWTAEQIEERRPGVFERAKDPKAQEKERTYLARLDGRPVGTGRLIYNCGLAFLGGASVVADVRGQRIYATLLAARLADAHARGYHIAAIQAAPMSRPIVAKYGFKPYARYLIYGWMPEPDLDVIKSLVPQNE